MGVVCKRRIWALARERRIIASDREHRLVAVLISFCSAKKDRSAPYSVDCWVLRQTIRPPSSVHSSIERSALHRALRLLSGVLPSIELYVFRQAFSSASTVPFSPFIDPSSVEHWAMRRLLCLPLVAPFCVSRPGRKECWESCVRVLLCLSDSRQLRTRARQRIRAIWGLCPPPADGVLLWAIWGLCPPSADGVLRRAIWGLCPPSAD